METLNVQVYAARTIPTEVRRRVIARDGMLCRRCSVAVVRRGTREPYRPDTLHLDHVIPWSEGGASTVENLIVSCAACNLSRPRPTRVARQCRIKIEGRDGGYHWPRNYAPPRPAGTDGETITLSEFATALFGGSVAQAIQSIDRGEVAATAAGPIRVELPAALVGATINAPARTAPPIRRKPKLRPVGLEVCDAYWRKIKNRGA